MLGVDPDGATGLIPGTPGELGVGGVLAPGTEVPAGGTTELGGVTDGVEGVFPGTTGVVAAGGVTLGVAGEVVVELA